MRRLWIGSVPSLNFLNDVRQYLLHLLYKNLARIRWCQLWLHHEYMFYCHLPVIERLHRPRAFKSSQKSLPTSQSRRERTLHTHLLISFFNLKRALKRASEHKKIP